MQRLPDTAYSSGLPWEYPYIKHDFTSYLFHIEILSSLVHTDTHLVDYIFHHLDMVECIWLQWEHQYTKLANHPKSCTTSSKCILKIIFILLQLHLYIYIPVSHWAPVQPGAHWHTFGWTQVPPFRHGGVHMAAVKTPIHKTGKSSQSMYHFFHVYTVVDNCYHTLQ